MPFLWSDPNSQGKTAAELTSQTRIDPIDIGHIIAAIIQHKSQQAAQDQQAMQQGVSSVANAYSQYKQRSAADDAANAAMYQAQYPNDNPSIEGFSDRVPDMGGASGLQSTMQAQAIQDALMKRQMNAWKYGQEQQMAPLEMQKLQAEIANTQSQARERDRAYPDVNQGVIYDENGQAWRMGAKGQLVNVNTPQTKEIQMATTNLSKKGAPYGLTSQQLGGLDVDTPDVVGFYSKDYSKKLSTEEAKADPDAVAVLPDKTTMLAKDYMGVQPYVRQVQSLRKNLPVGTGSGATQTATGSQAEVGRMKGQVSGVRQSDVDAAARSTPTTDDISYLKAHPELRARFDAKYGQGAASQYLDLTK